MICEPIVFDQDDEGNWHFAEAGLPLKTKIDVHGGLLGLWIRTEYEKVIIELDGRSVIYDRIGFTPEGYWVCRLRVDPATVYGQQS